MNAYSYFMTVNFIFFESKFPYSMKVNFINEIFTETGPVNTKSSVPMALFGDKAAGRWGRGQKGA